MNPNLKFNPDELVLTKSDVLELFDGISQRWKKNKKDNWKFLASLEMMKAGVHMTGEDTIKAIWSEILHGFNELLIQNSLAIAKGNNESWAETFEKIKKSKKSDLDEQQQD